MENRANGLGQPQHGGHHSRWNDGLPDLAGGIGLLIAGAAWSTDLAWASGFAVPILFVGWILLSRRLVKPRIGQVTDNGDRRRVAVGGVLGSALFGTLLFFVVIYFLEIRTGGGVGAWIREWIAMVPAALLTLMALTTAAVVRLPRFIGYAAVMAVSGWVGARIGWEPGPQMIVAGALITLVGLTIFLRFLGRHPVPAV